MKGDKTEISLDNTTWISGMRIKVAVNSFQDLSTTVFIQLCAALVRPRRGYDMPACTLNLVADITNVERFER